MARCPQRQFSLGLDIKPQSITIMNAKILNRPTRVYVQYQLIRLSQWGQVGVEIFDNRKDAEDRQAALRIPSRIEEVPIPV